MIGDVVDLLQCPHCAGPLLLSGGTVGCDTGHRFDVARQGQLNLLGKAAGATADTAEMVGARAAFLAGGHYQPIAELVARSAMGSVLVEPGAGTGYYLNAVVAAANTPDARGLATDLSAYACRRAAKLPDIGAVVADTWAGLPIRDQVASTVLTVFAPRNAAEFARICARSGRVLVITPLPEHLTEVRQASGLLTIEPDKQDRLLADTHTSLIHLGHQDLRYEVTLSAADLTHLIEMGPNAFHPSRRDAHAMRHISRTTVAVRLDVFQPR